MGKLREQFLSYIQKDSNTLAEPIQFLERELSEHLRSCRDLRCLRLIGAGCPISQGIKQRIYSLKEKASKLVAADKKNVADRVFVILGDTFGIADSGFEVWEQVLKTTANRSADIPWAAIAVSGGGYSYLNGSAYVYSRAVELESKPGFEKIHAKEINYDVLGGYVGYILVGTLDAWKRELASLVRPPTVKSEKKDIPLHDVNWEILPASIWNKETADAFIDAILGDDKRNTILRGIALDRYQFFKNLKSPTIIRFVRGLGAFTRYFGVQFTDDLVVLENIHEGNAIYVMLEKWESLARVSKSELIATREEGRRFVRIVHSATWKERLTKLLLDITEPNDKHLTANS
jgi:hypothetical protein